MNVRLDCRSRKAHARGCIVIRGKNAAAGKKVLQLFEKLQLTFSLQFLTQSIERAASEGFGPPQFE